MYDEYIKTQQTILTEQMIEEYGTGRSSEQVREATNMTAITLLLGLGICVFLLWFFESLFKESYVEDEYEQEYVRYEPVYGEQSRPRR